MNPISVSENIDCMEGLKKLPYKYFDWAIVDIPYGLDVCNMPFIKEKGTVVRQKNGTLLNPNKNKVIHENKDWDKATPTQQYFDQLRRVSKNQIIFGVDYVNWQGLGTGRIKWNKGVSEGMSFSKYEMAYCSSIEHEEEIFCLWSGFQQAKSSSEPYKAQGNKKLNEKRIHPCQKPKILYELIFDKFCKKGDYILDTHMGSQNSRIVAYKKGFDFWGFEIDKDYYQQGNDNFQKSISMPLFDAPIEQKQMILL